ncbi:MAG: DUF4340 domain-containing protein [Elainella sp.]
MLKPSTLGFVVAALVLGLIVAVVGQQPAPQPAGQQVTEQESQIFEFKEADVQAFSLQTRLRTLKFERGQDGKWQMLEPEKTAASDPSVAFLLDLVATGRTPRTISAPASDRQQYGLHQPLATLDLTLKDQKTHRLVIGEYDFNRAYLYAQADPPGDSASPPPDLKVLLLSPNFDQAVNRPLEEWKQAAPAAKPSPGTSPGASPEASPSASPSGSPAPSPAPNPESSPSPSPSPSPSASPPESPAASPSPEASAQP